jgi:uncharacterized protein (TIGR02996 family)
MDHREGRHRDLLAAVYAAPDDDAPREAYAAWLDTQRDPRAEFIRLQLAAAKAGKWLKADKGRASALLKAHGKAWAAPLEGAVAFSSLKWDRGFPSEGKLATQRNAAAEEATCSVEAFGTLRVLTLGYFRREYLERLLTHTPMHQLREVIDLPRSLLPMLASSTRPWALERITCPLQGGNGLQGEKDEPLEMAGLAQALASGSGLPRLTSLSLTFCYLGKPDAWDWLATTAAGRRLRVLRMNHGSYYLPLWHAALEEWGDRTGLQRLELFNAHHFELHRTPAGWSRLTGAIHVESHPENERRDLEPAVRQMTLSDVDIKNRT